jgi:transcription elongation GreA/GreB family factor
MPKENVRQLIIEQLGADLAILFAAAKAAHEAAIHEETSPDNKYDTLSLEASYVAQGQANRAQEIREAIDIYKNTPLQRFQDDSPIRLTALVTLTDETDSWRTVFLGPQAGGLKISLEGAEVVVITPESPLGRCLLGKVTGDVVALELAGVSKELEIVAVA